LDNDDRKEKFNDYDLIFCEYCDCEIDKNSLRCFECYDMLKYDEERVRWDYGRCKECFEINQTENWCQKCNAKRFQQDFPNWTSGNEFIDKGIQKAQLNAKNYEGVLEWIPYNKFEDIKKIENMNGNVDKAIWLDGNIRKWSYDEGKWTRHNREWNYDEKKWIYNITKIDVALKSLNKSSNLSDEYFFNKLTSLSEHFNIFSRSVRLYGFTQNPKNLDYMMVIKFEDVDCWIKR